MTAHFSRLFNPEQIILAGSLAGLEDGFLANVRETARGLGDAGRDCAIVSLTMSQYNRAVGPSVLTLHK